MSSLRELWDAYTAASSRSAANDMGLPPPPNAVGVGIDGARFLKLCKDSKLFSIKGHKFRPADTDLIFSKYHKKRRLDFSSFQKALVEMATKMDVNGEALVERLLTMTADGPSIKGTFAEAHRLHDDKSTYTGVYKAGGPTTIDYEKMGMNNLCDRSKKATLRGVPEIAVYGPGNINVLMAPNLPKSPFNHVPHAHVSSGPNTPGKGDKSWASGSGSASIGGQSYSSGSLGGIENMIPESSVDLSNVNYENMSELRLPKELRKKIKSMYVSDIRGLICYVYV